MASFDLIASILGAVGWAICALLHTTASPYPVWFVRFAFAMLSFHAALRAAGL